MTRLVVSGYSFLRHFVFRREKVISNGLIPKYTKFVYSLAEKLMEDANKDNRDLFEYYLQS